MVKNTITIGHLYPKQMNVYGDMGNVIVLQYRLAARGYDVVYKPINRLQSAKNLAQVDILVGGGGQDSNQELIQDDLIKTKAELLAQCNDGLVALVICGMYQMFGNKFVLPDGREIAGAGILDIETKAGDDRLIGNVVVESPFGRLVGFENHSGRTYLSPQMKSIGTVIKGKGNNGEDDQEGVIEKNVFGSYMHGPALAKNPALADELIHRALLRKYGQTEIEPLDDFIEHQAAAIAMKRPR